MFGGRSRPRYATRRWLLRVWQIGDGSSQGRNVWDHGPEHLPRLGLQERGFLCFQDVHIQGAVQRSVRVELFNLFNHPNIANPYGSATNSAGGNDPSSPSTFGCGCATPDVAAGNPLV